MELAARLDTHVLAYWVHPEAVYIWLVNPSGALHGERVVVREERLNHWIERVRRDAERPDREAWRQLFSVLIQPVRNRLPAEAGAELTILPHGALFQLPFAALTSQSGRYLIEDFALRTAPAAAFLDVRGPRNGAPRRYLLVGAPQTLPGARRELEGIASSGAPGQFTLLSGKNASRDRFLALAPDATVVHFATHAVVDPVQPFGSYLQLHGGSRLTAEEVYNLRLNADLVMLAACRSGSGKVSADGLLGLTRAFFYAGARSVIAPLWDVADQPTARLMTDFYREYQRDQRKVRALRAAQLRLLSDLRAGNVEVTTAAGPMILPEQPWLWAGFVLQGED